MVEEQQQSKKFTEKNKKSYDRPVHDVVTLWQQAV